MIDLTEFNFSTFEVLIFILNSFSISTIIFILARLSHLSIISYDVSLLINSFFTFVYFEIIFNILSNFLHLLFLTTYCVSCMISLFKIVDKSP